MDTETSTPEAGAAVRGIASGQLQIRLQKAVLGLRDMVKKAQRSAGLDDQESEVVRILTRRLDYFTKVPPELLDRIERTTTAATVVWRKVRRWFVRRLLQSGATYSPKELHERVFGEVYNPEWLLRYLTHKYLEH